MTLTTPTRPAWPLLTARNVVNPPPIPSAGKLKATQMAKTETNATTFYANVFKAWPKACGAKPDAAMLDTVHKLCAEPGKQALALALMLRPEGVSGAQIVMACGAPQLNKMRETCTRGLAKRLPAPATETGHTVYKLALTAKGETKVAKANAAPEAPAKKAKGASKRKAKGDKVTEPVTVETVPATEPVTEQPAA